MRYSRSGFLSASAGRQPPGTKSTFPMKAVAKARESRVQKTPQPRGRENATSAMRCPSRLVMGRTARIRSWQNRQSVVRFAARATPAAAP